jgi:spore maturation protein B
MNISDYAMPSIIVFAMVFGLCRRVDIFSEFTAGIKEGLQTVLDVFPSLFALVVAVGMMRASGAIETIAAFVSPATGLLGFPEDVVPLALLRPFSGSAATALYEQTLTFAGADSFAGKVASVIIGSSETTFYTIAVYFSATKIRKTRHTLPAALLGDCTVWILACLFVRLLNI